jgi:hypothetical protein
MSERSTEENGPVYIKYDTTKTEFFKGDWRNVHPKKIPVEVPEWANVVLLAVQTQHGLYPFAMRYPDKVYQDKLEEIIADQGDSISVVAIPANTTHMVQLVENGEVIEPKRVEQ